MHRPNSYDGCDAPANQRPATSSNWEGYDPPQYRLRVEDYRFIFLNRGEDSIEVIRVRNRRDAYR
jgi:hypothetical protein